MIFNSRFIICINNNTKFTIKVPQFTDFFINTPYTLDAFKKIKKDMENINNKLNTSYGFEIAKINDSYPIEQKIKELKSMSFARSNANTTIMPDGSIFINGGHSYSDLEFSVFTPEIYNPNTQITKELAKSYFRRNRRC